MGSGDGEGDYKCWEIRRREKCVRTQPTEWSALLRRDDDRDGPVRDQRGRNVTSACRSLHGPIQERAQGRIIGMAPLVWLQLRRYFGRVVGRKRTQAGDEVIPACDGLYLKHAQCDRRIGKE
jgi:hypothetical protein